MFAKTIDTMDEQRWARIINAAKAYVGKRDPDQFDRAKVSAAPLLDAENSSDDEILHDSMFDEPLPMAPASTAADLTKSRTTSPQLGAQPGDEVDHSGTGAKSGSGSIGDGVSLGEEGLQGSDSATKPGESGTNVSSHA